MSKTEFLQEENIQVYFPSNVYDYNEQGRQKERVLVKIDLFFYILQGSIMSLTEWCPTVCRWRGTLLLLEMI